jgi:hypothetical protein
MERNVFDGTLRSRSRDPRSREFHALPDWLGATAVGNYSVLYRQPHELGNGLMMSISALEGLKDNANISEYNKSCLLAWMQKHTHKLHLHTVTHKCACCWFFSSWQWYCRRLYEDICVETTNAEIVQQWTEVVRSGNRRKATQW